MRNAFFHLQSFFVLKIFKVLSCIFCLIRMIRLISEVMTSQPWKETIAIHMLPIISRTEDKQTKKFGKLRENNMSNNFLEKAYTKCGGKTIARQFSKKLKLSIFRIKSLNFYVVCFNCMPNCGRTNYIETKFQNIETKLQIIETNLSL